MTEVLTGDTIVVQTTQAKFTLKLQYADAPEGTQPLFSVVKTHLSDFVFQKTVSFELKAVSAGTHHSKIFLDGVDLSLQMLRDGAVWYAVPDAAYQAADERILYLDAEAKAKAEKRGVWGIAGIKPAYELRLQREKELQEKLEAERKKWLESALAMIKYSEPAVGMDYFSFESLCSPSQSGDSSTTHDFGRGVEISKSLVWTSEREETGCYGSFSFDERRKLTYISRSSRVK
ncbi:MAG: hypothetical protein ABI481_05675 [Pyrinomonadaceae bacterium]